MKKDHRLDAGGIEIISEAKPKEDEVLSAKEIRRRIGPINPIQFEIWRKMTPAQRLDIAFQAYQFALDAVRSSERARAEDGLTEEEFNWRVTRRMQGDPNLGREYDKYATTK